MLARAMAHGVSHRAISAAGGGSFQAGFAGGFLGSCVHTSGLFDGEKWYERVGQAMMAAAVGGTACAIGGGKFENGAMCAAMVALLNPLMDKVAESNSSRAFLVPEYDLPDDFTNQEKYSLDDQSRMLTLHNDACKFAAAALATSDGNDMIFSGGAFDDATNALKEYCVNNNTKFNQIIVIDHGVDGYNMQTWNHADISVRSNAWSMVKGCLSNTGSIVLFGCHTGTNYNSCGSYAWQLANAHQVTVWANDGPNHIQSYMVHGEPRAYPIDYSNFKKF